MVSKAAKQTKPERLGPFDRDIPTLKKYPGRNHTEISCRGFLRWNLAIVVLELETASSFRASRRIVLSVSQRC